jgi:hypothetical protein
VPEVFDGDTTSLDGEGRDCALFGLFWDDELCIADEDDGTVLYKSRKTANNPVDGKYSPIMSRCILGSRGGYPQKQTYPCLQPHIASSFRLKQE